MYLLGYMKCCRGLAQSNATPPECRKVSIHLKKAGGDTSKGWEA